MVAVAALLEQVKAAWQFIASLALTSYMYSSPAVLQPGASSTIVIVGAGTAGSIIANRLAENPFTTVILIEKGGDPPIQSELTGTFPLLARSVNDWSYKAVNDNRIAQNTKNKSIEVTMGKMLGGTSSLNHATHTRGHPQDYDEWAKMVCDESWNYENMLEYLKKPEKMTDEEILATNADTYGTDGYVELTKSHEKIAQKYLDAFNEIGRKTKVDTNGANVVGYAEPVLYISKDGKRQSTAQTYLTQLKNKTNVQILKNTEVTKIIIKNGVATGVVARNATGEFTVEAGLEIILAAGAINTPKLLLLSGIGPADDLKKLNIPLVSDLPVGKNLQDHASVLLEYKMAASNSPKLARDPHKYPVPAFTGYASITDNSDSAVPEYQTTNLIFEHDSDNILQLCSALFNLDDDIGEAFFNASVGHETVLTALSLLHPKSHGTVTLKSANYTDDPLITLNLLKNEEDLNNMAKYLKDFAKVVNSTYYKSVGAEFVNLNIGCGANDNSDKYLKCHAERTAVSFWQYVGSCAQGKVVDNNLKVYEVAGLRVADASIIPKATSAFLMAPVMALAEKAADLIKIEHYPSDYSTQTF